MTMTSKSLPLGTDEVDRHAVNVVKRRIMSLLRCANLERLEILKNVVVHLDRSSGRTKEVDDIIEIARTAFNELLRDGWIARRYPRTTFGIRISDLERSLR